MKKDQNIDIRISTDMKEKWKKFAEADNRSLSNYIVSAVEAHIKINNDIKKEKVSNKEKTELKRHIESKNDKYASELGKKVILADNQIKQLKKAVKDIIPPRSNKKMKEFTEFINQNIKNDDLYDLLLSKIGEIIHGENFDSDQISKAQSDKITEILEDCMEIIE